MKTEKSLLFNSNYKSHCDKHIKTGQLRLQIISKSVLGFELKLITKSYCNSFFCFFISNIIHSDENNFIAYSKFLTHERHFM